MSNEIIYPNALPVGTILNGQYCIEEVLGQGGFGITYLGRDLNLEVKVAIKEYYPEGIVARDNTTRKVTVYAGDKREDFEYGAERFLDEAKILGRFQNNGYIVGVRNFFRENDTAYFVMDYIEGISFKEYLKKMDGRILYQDALALLVPIMEALEQVHQTGLLHRDISPDNIYITFEGKSKLLDFGAARSTLGEHSKSLSVILKPGYAPEEQYRSKGKQGPWTDVYALSATLYMAITGMLPPDALDRLDEDELKLPSELGIEVPPYLEQALKKGLAIKAYDRYQSIKELREGLLGEENQETKEESSKSTPELKTESKIESHIESKQALPLLSKASLVALKEKYKKQMVLGGITLVGVVITTVGIVWVLNTREKSTLAANPTTDIVADDNHIAPLEEEHVQDNQDKEEAAKLEAQKAQEEALRQEELKKEAIRQEIKAIADKSYTNIQLKDDKGDIYTAYLYADNATQEIASMENGSVWAGASEGNLIVHGEFKVAYVKENGTEIKTYDLGKDIGYNTQLNITWNADCKRVNQYDGQPDFMVITIPETSNSSFYYLYVMHEGELKPVQFNDGAWYTSLMDQIGPTTFGVGQQEMWETGLYMIDEIRYDINTQSFSALTSESMMTPFNYTYYRYDNSRELSDDEALDIIEGAYQNLTAAFTFYDEFGSTTNGYMRPANFIVGTMEKMKGFLGAYWSPVYVDALMSKYNDVFQEIDGELYIAPCALEPYFDFTTAEVLEVRDNGNTRVYKVSLMDGYGYGEENIVTYTLTYTSLGWVMFDGGSVPYL